MSNDKKTHTPPPHRQMKNDGNCGCFNSFCNQTERAKDEKWTHRSEKLTSAHHGKKCREKTTLTVFCEFHFTECKKDSFVLFSSHLCALAVFFSSTNRENEVKEAEWQRPRIRTIFSYHSNEMQFLIVSMCPNRCAGMNSGKRQRERNWNNL